MTASERAIEAASVPLEGEVAAYAGLERWALADRWRIYARLREEAPVYGFGNSALITRYDDVIAVLMDKERVHNGGPSHGVPADVLARLSAGERELLDEIIDWEERWLTSVNGARHTELRGLGQRIFSPRVIPDMRERAVELTALMLDEIAARATVELISEFAYKLPLTMISEILDIPEELREPLHRTAKGMMVARTGLAWRMQLPQGLEQAHRHFMEMKRLILEVLELRRRAPDTTPLMRNMLDALDDDGVSDDDVIVLMQLLITAGHRTTTDLLGNAMHALLTHRDQWQLLCSEPARIADAVEEVLRYRSPGQDVERFANAPFSLRGVDIEQGRHLTIIVGAANFDQRHFVDPDRFDIARPDSRAHVSFGRGPHFCLGNALARLEGQIAIGAIAARFPDAELVDEEPDWAPNTHLLGLSTLELALGPDRG
ncbi:MAG TPA: cytochrome P450 [Solirubrobacteraceae bacterium]